MEVFYARRDIKKQYPRLMLCLGVFDGLHRGHRRLIESCVKHARAVGGTAMVITFSPHPVQVLRPEIALPQITALPYRLQLMAEMGVHLCWVVRFTRRFASLSPEQFIRRYLIKDFHPEGIYIGDDFRFGQNRSGTLNSLKRAGREFGFWVRTLKVGKGGEKSLSSSTIRQDIAEGRLEKAARLLGKPFALYGRVVHGDRRGRLFGYPTANINIENQIHPPEGVYVVGIVIGKKKYFGLANLGKRPTFKKEGRVNLEVHVFQFKENLYRRHILVIFYQRMRDEKYFSSAEALKFQLAQDEKFARQWLAQHPSIL